MTTKSTVEPWREHLARALDWEDAHVGFHKTVADIPADKRGARAAGFAHTPWQLLEHLRIALEDLADFAVNPHYTHSRGWPDDYWPTHATPSGQEWEDSVAAYRAALARLQHVARDGSLNLLAPVPTGNAGQTHLRNLLLAIDHNAYHLGQLVAVRRALGIWS
jgi:uncharacterized damage-inducible protein DinB